MSCSSASTIWASLSRREQLELSAAFWGSAPAGPPQDLTWVSLERHGLAAWSGDLLRWELTPLGANVARPPVVMLDMDGVVSRVISRPRRPGESEDDWMARQATAHERLNEVAVQRLNRIVAETGALFVSSSTWRLGQAPEVAARTITAWLQAKGFVGQVVDATPDHGDGAPRWREIQAWLDRQGVPPRAFAILDDWWMGPLAHRAVQTDYDRLVTDADVARVIAMLSPPAVGRAQGRTPAVPAGVTR